MARMKFFYTVKTLKWFMTYRSYTYADESAVKERDELIEQRARQLYEIDMVLFDKVDMPVLIPDRIIESQKALAKKQTTMGKNKRSSLAATAGSEGDAAVKSPTGKKNRSLGNGSSILSKGGLSAMMVGTSNPPSYMTQSQIDKQLQYYMLEPEDVSKEKVFNSMTRLQNLMTLDVMYIDKAVEYKKKAPIIDTPATQESMRVNAALVAACKETQEPKGRIETVPVYALDRKQHDQNGQAVPVEVLQYVMRIGEKMPTFNFWPRGKEIIHRLIMKAALADNISEFAIYETDESALESIIFRDQQVN